MSKPMLPSNWLKRLALLAVSAVLVANPLPCSARTLLKNICRVKGQEENTLRGLGLVVGLKGTGDSPDNLPTMRALATAMEMMGHPLSIPDAKGNGGLAELKKVKSVALVWVNATVPPTGARAGDKLDCQISAIGDAKSLVGGRLAFAGLQGPNLRDPRLYALAEGQLHLDDQMAPTAAKIFQGCRMEEDLFTPFAKEGKLTLVLNKNYADFQIASGVAQVINSQLGYGRTRQSEDRPVAVAIDSANIVVEIPETYHDSPVDFVAEVMDLQIIGLDTEARVVINERAGSIVIGGDVEIGPVVVTHKNIVIDASAAADTRAFVGVDPAQTDAPRLRSLVEALNKVKVPTPDVIEIIKGLERNGKLHGRLIIE